MRRLTDIGAGTRVCAVIGHPLGHTLSPAIHNAAYEALGLDFVYVALPVERAGDALAALRAFDTFRGLSITIPHKLEALRHVDEVGDLDRRIGSINTAVKENGRLIGLGTDGPGALKALRDAGHDPAGRRVLLLGAGGAARAIAFTLAGPGGADRIVLLDINEALLGGLVGDLRAGAACPVEGGGLDAATVARAVAGADLVVQCTPVGMHPRVDESLVPAGLWRRDQVVFDIVYNPLRTRLLREAEAAGAAVVRGVEMFVNQAVLQFERFTGAAAPVEVMRRAVLEQLGA